MRSRDDVGQEFLRQIRRRRRRDGVFEAESKVADGVGVAGRVAHAYFRVEPTEWLNQLDESQIVLCANRVAVCAGNDRDLRAESVFDELIVRL